MPLAAVSVLILVAVLILIAVLVIVLVLIVVLIAILVLIPILVIHVLLLLIRSDGIAALLGYPAYQDLSLALNRKLAARPATMAAVIPPAAAFSPPVKMPRNPSFVTASFTPLARRLPKPVSGTDAPAHANSMSFGYTPTAPKRTPTTT